MTALEKLRAQNTTGKTPTTSAQSTNEVSALDLLRNTNKGGLTPTTSTPVLTEPEVVEATPSVTETGGGSSDNRSFLELQKDAALYGAGKVGTGVLGALEGVNDIIGSTFYTGVSKIADLLNYPIYTFDEEKAAQENTLDKLSQFAKEKAASYLENSITDKLNQKLDETYNPTKGMQIGGTINETVSGMLPSIAAGNLVGAAGSGLNAASQAAKGTNVSKALFGLSAAGNAASEATSEGADTGKALTYGATAGLLETTIEGIAGGIPGMGKGKVAEIVEKLTSNATVSKILDIVGEGGEEALSTFVTPYLKRAIYDENAENATAAEIAQSAAMGMIASGILQAGIELPSAISSRAQSKAETAVNPENQPTTGTNDTAPTDTPTEQKTAPNAAEVTKDTIVVPAEFIERLKKGFWSSDSFEQEASYDGVVFSYEASPNAPFNEWSHNAYWEYLRAAAAKEGKNIDDIYASVVSEQKTAPNATEGAGAEDYYFDESENNTSWRERTYTENGKTYVQSQDRQRMYEVPAQSEIRYEVRDDGSVVLDDDVLSNLSPKDYRDFAKAYAELNLVTKYAPDHITISESKPVTINSTGSNVIITQTGINEYAKKLRGKGIKNKDNVSSVLLLNKLIENATPVSSSDNVHSETGNPFTYYKSKFEVGGRTYNVTLHIKNVPSGDHYYYHTLNGVDIEDGTKNVTSTYGSPARSGEYPNEMEATTSGDIVTPDEPVVKSGDTTFGPNTVGAAEAQFKYQEAPTQSVADNLFSEQEQQDHNLKNKHQVYTDAEANALADQLLAQDYDGEVSRLRDPDSVWDKTANSEGHRILEDLIAKARKSGSEADWDAVREWKALYDRKGGTEHGQALQGRKQFATSTAEIVSEAAETLEGPDIRKLKPRKKAQLLDEVYNQAETYNNIEKGDLDSLISLIKRNNEIRRTTGLFSKTTSKQMDWALHKVVEQFPDTAEQFLREVAVSQIRNIASDYNKVGLTEAAKSVRIMNMLSKISTIMRNLASNNIFDPLESLSNDVGLISDAIMSLKTGQRTTTFDPSWFSKAKRSGSLEGALKSYIEVGLDAPVEDATSRYEGTGAGRTFKMAGNPFARFLSTWSKYENYALKTTDEFQKGGIRAEAQREIDTLKSQGKLGKDALQEWADETARQRTFQNDSVVSQAMEMGRDALNFIHVGDIGAGDILLPFAKVPGNLAAQSANYSPLGLANNMRQMVEVMIDAKNGNVDVEKQAQVARNFGRGVTGTALLAGFAALAAKGLIVVAGADDDDKEAMEKAQGKTGTQWNLTATLRALNGGSTEWQDGDTLVSIGSLDPINSIMAAGSLLADDIAEDGYQLGDLSKASLGGVWQAILDLPAMTSISDLINSYKYAEGETDAEKLINAGLDYAGSQAASFVVPNAVRGIATGMDNIVRNQYSGETVGESTLDSIKSGIPVLRETLPASLDPFGNEKTQTGNTLLNFLNNNILPGAVTKYKETDVQSVLEELYSVTGNAAIYPDRKAPNSFSSNDVTYSLNSDQKDEFMRIAGSTAEDLMNDLIDTKTFRSANKTQQAAYLELANKYSREMAKYELSNGKYELSSFASSANEALDMGIPLSTFLPYYENAGNYNEDGEGSLKIAERSASIDESDMNRQQQLAVYEIFYPSWKAKSEELGVEWSAFVDYKVITNTAEATKKADKIQALVDAGYSRVEAIQLYNKMNTKMN